MASLLHGQILQGPALLLLISLLTHHITASYVQPAPKSWPEIYQLLNPALNDHVCSTWGNYHYRTFDGDFYQFPGLCNYLFASNCLSPCENFNIQIRRSDDPENSVLVYVVIKIAGLIIELRNEKITVGEEKVSLPFSQLGIQIQQSNGYVKLTTKIGLVLFWNNEDALMLKLSPKYMSTTCGLCGNMNGVSQDEFRIDDMILSPVQYANMQKLDGPTEQCEDYYFFPPDNCSELQEVCAHLFSSPAFRDCDVRLSKDPYIDACMYDICLCQSSNLSCACDTLAEYSRQCAIAGGRPRNWRDKMCEITCQMNLKYDECGSPCADTCSNCERTDVCDEPCMEGCFCPPGTVLDDVKNQGCIRFKECPCTYNNRIYAPGESFSNNCQNCICQGGQWDCQALPCPGHCSLEGGSHIFTYDGGNYNFHGDCSYIFTKDCVGNIFNVLVDLRKCGNSHTETCLKSVTLYLDKGLTIVTVKCSGSVLLNGVYARAPLFTDSFALLNPSSFYLIIKSYIGIQIQIQMDPVMQLSVSLDPEYMGIACGLCGDFNNIRTDDFRSASGVLEGTASAFANSWKSYGNCPDIKDSYENPCSLSVENERFAQHWCSYLLDPNGPFAPCHAAVNPTIYENNCMYDSCNYEKSEDSVCAAFGAYVRACAVEGVNLVRWRGEICDKYTQKCSKNSTYQYSISTCQTSCRSLSEPDPSCSFNFPSVDGCACPQGTFLDESGACVPIKQCSCYYKGSIMSPGEVIYDNGAMCTCLSGRLYCVGKIPIIAACPANMIYFDCANASMGQKGAECQRTCQTLDLECFSMQCTSGCICPGDLVLNNNGRCIPEEKCPCVHNGEDYHSGETIQQDCNTCICSDRKWQCTKKECHKTCVVYGEGHYITFDGKRFDFSGDCEYTLTQDFCLSNSGNGSFRVITENIPCGTTGATCSKAIRVFLGNYELKLSDRSYEVVERDVGSEVPYQIRQMGIFLVVDAVNGLSLVWDKKTTLFMKLSPEFQGQVCGLCGNYDGSVLNDFTTRSQSVVVNVQEFGNSWKDAPTCPDAVPLSDPCLTNPSRQDWSQKHCSIFMGSTFTKCHSKVDPTPYHDACVHDTCACDSGGDCECFCTAVAAYAAACNEAGICMSWRTPEICPVFCDYYNPEGECEWHYKPCGDPCMKTCRNPSGHCTNYLPGLEGCYPKCPNRRPFFDEDSMKCVTQVNCGCYDADGKRYNIGDVVPSYKNCESCICTKKGLRCQADVRACYCYYDNVKHNYGDVVYSTTDGMGGCITATCSSDGTIIRTVYYCGTTTTGPTTTFHFETVNKTTLHVSTSEKILSKSVKPPTTKPQLTTHSTSCHKETCSWTAWFDVYSPDKNDIFDGDFETFENIRAAGNDICQQPQGIRCRVSDFPDKTIEEHGQVVTCNVTHGLVCNNKDQIKKFRSCYNYQVQILCCSLEDCEPSTKSVTHITSSNVNCILTCVWSEWFDVSFPASNNDGDFETYERIRNSGYEVCHEPSDIQCRSTDHPNSSLEELQQNVHCNDSYGLTCWNKEQTGQKPYCYNYEIRVYCCSGCESTKGITTKHSVSTKHVTTRSNVTPSLHQSTKNIVTSLPKESTAAFRNASTVEVVHTSTPKIKKTTRAITTPHKKVTENTNSVSTQKPITTTPIKLFTTSLKHVSMKTIKPPTESGEVTSTFKTTVKVTSPKTSAAFHKSTTEFKKENVTSEKPGTLSTESQRVISQPSKSTSKPISTTQCACDVKGNLVPSGKMIYNTTDKEGWCYYAKCNQDCELERYSELCHRSTVPTTTSSTKTTNTVTTSKSTTKKTRTPYIPETTTRTSASPPVSTANPGCSDYTPPRRVNETWIIDQCTQATCIGQNKIAINKKQCASLTKGECANRLRPKKIFDSSGCCYKLGCKCICGGWGTSHYMTFDGTNYTFNAQCTYVLVQQRIQVFDHFRVYIENFSCKPDDPTCVTTLRIIYKNETIVLKSQSLNKTITNQIYVNEELVYPAININGILITSSYIFVIVEIPEMGAYISFNILSFTVKIPLDKFINNTEGLCGQCSNNRADDCTLPNGELASSCSQMAEQWRAPNEVPSSCNSIPTMVPLSPFSTLLSRISHTTLAEVPSSKLHSKKPGLITGADEPCQIPEVCNFILSSFFSECHNVVPPGPYFETCVIDGCTTFDGDILCSSLLSYARICGMAGVCRDWTNSTNGSCLKTCSSGLVYKPCGPAVEPTCNSRYNDDFFNKTKEDYMEGCYCPKGTTKFNTVSEKCVSVCGCTGPDGLPKLPGEKWDSDCQTCICDKTSMSVICATKPCGFSAPKKCTEEGQMPVSVRDRSNPCCTVIECRCNMSLCSKIKMICEPGYEAVPYMNPELCCPVYNCELKKVCVRDGIEYQLGATVPSSDPCEKCICDEKMIDKTGLHHVTCVSLICLKKCAEGYSYTNDPGKCCGICKQTHCIVGLPDKTTFLLKPGDTGSPPGDNCTIYTCSLNNDNFVTVASKMLCPAIDRDDCVQGTIQMDDRRCCIICVKALKKCQIIKVKTTIWEHECHSLEPVEMSYCKGSCESYSMFSQKSQSMEQRCPCCEETKAKKITIGLWCPNGKMVKYSYINAVACDCVESFCKKEARKPDEEEDLSEEYESYSTGTPLT